MFEIFDNIAAHDLISQLMFFLAHHMRCLIRIRVSLVCNLLVLADFLFNSISELLALLESELVQRTYTPGVLHNDSFALVVGRLDWQNPLISLRLSAILSRIQRAMPW